MLHEQGMYYDYDNCPVYFWRKNHGLSLAMYITLGRKATTLTVYAKKSKLRIEYYTNIKKHEKNETLVEYTKDSKKTSTVYYSKDQGIYRHRLNHFYFWGLYSLNAVMKETGYLPKRLYDGTLDDIITLDSSDDSLRVMNRGIHRYAYDKHIFPVYLAARIWKRKTLQRLWLRKHLAFCDAFYFYPGFWENIATYLY